MLNVKKSMMSIISKAFLNNNKCYYNILMEGQNYLVGIGNPIIDIMSNIDKDTLSQYNLEFNKTVFVNDTNIGFFDELERRNAINIPGGSVTNSIRVANVLIYINFSGC